MIGKGGANALAIYRLMFRPPAFAREEIVKFLTIMILQGNELRTAAENRLSCALFPSKRGSAFPLVGGPLRCREMACRRLKGRGVFFRILIAAVAKADDAAAEALMIEVSDVQCQSRRTPPARGRSGFSLT
ncbi:hypothetical protein ABVB72_00435 [Rhizobium nepotum]|uniref:hypothetical protein n=1 Tax=Rhizobium nepotum TaxID=1035271 RepID=UPI00336A590C